MYGKREVYRGRVSRGFLMSQYPMVRVLHTRVHAQVDTQPKKGYHQTWGETTSQKNAQNWPQVLSTLTPSVKAHTLIILGLSSFWVYCTFEGKHNNNYIINVRGKMSWLFIIWRRRM
jgi:hypothetical protein